MRAFSIFRSAEAGYAGRVTTPKALSTRVLLICAAIGVATGIVGGIAGVSTAFVLGFAPVIYGFVLGVHVLPGIIAQEALRLPLVAIITHLIAALVATAFMPGFIMSFLGTALLFGGIQEGVAAITRYRAWGPWRFFISGAIIGVVVAVAVYFAAHMRTMPLWAQVLYLALSVLGPIAWTAVGLAVGNGLRRAGVVRSAQR